MLKILQEEYQSLCGAHIIYGPFEYARLLPAAQILAFWFNNNLEEIRICCPASLNAPSSEQVSSPPDCNLYANSFWEEVRAVTPPLLAIQVPCWLGEFKKRKLLVWISTQSIPIPFWYIDNHVKFQHPSWCWSAAPRPPFYDPKIQRIFKIDKGKKFPPRFLFFLF